MEARPFDDLRDFDVGCADEAGIVSWLTAVCGAHELEIFQPERIRFRHRGKVLKSMSTVLGYVEFGTDARIGITDAGRFSSYMIDLPLCGQQRLNVAGRAVEAGRGRGVIVSPNQPQDLWISGDCRKLQVVICRVGMSRTLEEMLQQPLAQPLCFEPEMDAESGAPAAWWRMARHFVDEMACDGLYGHPHFSRDLESALIKGVLLAQPHNYSAALRRSLDVMPPHYLLRAKEFIHANARETVRLEDIENASGVSRFKLFEGFRRYFTMSPMAYLKSYRLAAVRQEILERGTTNNISEIAMGWGFMHLGRFAGEYRKRFDETPSATLRRFEVRRSQEF